MQSIIISWKLKMNSAKSLKQQTSQTPIHRKSLPKVGRRPLESVFPRHTLKDALEVPKAVWRDNAGDPYDPILLATKSLKTTQRSSVFRQLLSSSEQYDLTKGGSKAKAVTITQLGSAIVAPTDESKIGSSLREALLKPSIFNNFYTKYDRKNLPSEDIIKIVLEKEMKVLRSDVDACYDILMKNINDYGLTVQSGGNRVLYLDNLGKAKITVEQPVEEETLAPTEEAPLPQEKVAEKLVVKQIFVAHGKNNKPLEQLEKILTKFKVTYKVAIEEPHKGRPVSAKVAELMKSCGSGIFIFTADEETRDVDGNVIWRPSDNVVYELGAASVLYGNKIVIFKEDNVRFASDFSDIGYISFEKDKLDAKAADLMLELINLGFMQLTPT